MEQTLSEYVKQLQAINDIGQNPYVMRIGNTVRIGIE